MSEKESLGQAFIRKREERLRRRKNSPRAKPQNQPERESDKASSDKK